MLKSCLKFPVILCSMEGREGGLKRAYGRPRAYALHKISRTLNFHRPFLETKASELT